MASLVDQYTYSQTTNLQSKVRQAMASAAIAISGEAQAYNRNRVTLAIRILSPQGVANYLPVFIAAVTNDATVYSKIASGGATGTETDADVSNAVSASWNAIANQFGS